MDMLVYIVSLFAMTSLGLYCLYVLNYLKRCGLEILTDFRKVTDTDSVIPCGKSTE